MAIRIVPAFDYPEEVKSLFTEYTRMLVEGDSAFQAYLDLQNYDEEVRNLKMKYDYPKGRLYVALDGDKPAGCIGLKRIDDENCEMKRLYVRPEYRGQSLGQQLVSLIIKDAKEIGYQSMLLDTLPFLNDALHLYEKNGFYEIDCYNDSPMDTSIFMKLDLPKEERKMYVRKATVNDTASVTALWKSLVGTEFCRWDEEYPGQEEALRDAESGCLYVLCSESGDIIGAMSAGDDEELLQADFWNPAMKRPCGCSRLGILLQYQGQGLAEFLFSEVEKDIRKRGYDGIIFLVSPYHLKALALYHKMNYTKAGEMELYEMSWHCYEKLLKQKGEC